MKEQSTADLRQLAEFIQNETRNPIKIDVPFSGNENHIMLVPEGSGMKVVDLAEYMPLRPKTITEVRRLTEMKSFVAYVNEHKGPESRIFFNPNDMVFHAVFDYHLPADAQVDKECRAGWLKHSAILELRNSPQFNTWNDYANYYHDQAEFAEFLKDNRYDVTAPANAELLDLVMALEATTTAHTAGKVRTNEGIVLQYEESVTTNVPVPDAITLSIPLFAHGSIMDIQADLKLRVEGQRIRFAVRLLGVEEKRRAALDDARAHIETQTETPVYV